MARIEYVQKFVSNSLEIPYLIRISCQHCTIATVMKSGKLNNSQTYRFVQCIEFWFSFSVYRFGDGGYTVHFSTDVDKVIFILKVKLLYFTRSTLSDYNKIITDGEENGGSELNSSISICHVCAFECSTQQQASVK